MARYRFHIKSNEVSEQEITKNKDFKKLRHRYDNAVKPLYKRRLTNRKNRPLWIMFVLLFAVTLVIYEEQAPRHIQPIKLKKTKVISKPTSPRDLFLKDTTTTETDSTVTR